MRFAWMLLVVPMGMPTAARSETVAPDHAAKMKHGLELFRNDIRGILAQRCLACHGGEKTHGEFDLATREGLLKGGASGVLVKPNDAKNSLLMQLVRHEREPHMPEEQPKLADSIIAKLADWIDSGAPYDRPLVEAKDLGIRPSTFTEKQQKHWAFQPLAQPKVPAVGGANDVSALDRFILERLIAKKLALSPPAGKATLLRRLALDLTGMPPSPDEVDRFVADVSPDAYEKMVTSFLDRPAFGERWGRFWLDLARFAESHGYEQDYDRPTAYHYRDFVIQALNEDMPYDRFVRLQLAGDEMEPDNPLALMATGFLGAGTHATQITANQVEKERYDELDDMAATTGTALLGLTVGCARCHDHKFDPIGAYDYYRFVSTFTKTVRSDVDLDLNVADNKRQAELYAKKTQELKAELERFEKTQLDPSFRQWLAQAPTVGKPVWLIAKPEKLVADGGAKFAPQDDGSFLATGPNPNHDTYHVTITTTLPEITGLRLDALADKSMVGGGPGRAGNGNFALSTIKLTARHNSAKSTPQAVKLIHPKATFEQKGLPLSAALDDQPPSGWAVDPQFGKDHSAVFTFDPPLKNTDGVSIDLTLSFTTNTGHTIGRPRFSLTSKAGVAELAGEVGSLESYLATERALRTPANSRTPEQLAALLSYYKRQSSEWARREQPLREHLAKPFTPKLTKVMVCTEGLPAIRLHTQGGDFFEKTFFLKRGDLAQKQGEASQGFLRVLMRGGDERRWQSSPPKGWRTSHLRTGLANWITDTQFGAGPLLARVIVNRVWAGHFGRGIVSTPSDFGLQSEPPTHPELLDYLANELLRHGWRLKPIHRSIVTSATYRQGSAADLAQIQADPDNRWLARWRPRRLEAEAIRDSLLSVSGTLDPTPFGPGTLDEGSRRRSIYFFVKRSQLIPLMMLFDAPDTLQSMGKRSQTTVAPQAMALLNNPHIRAYARSFAKRLSTPTGAPAETVRQAYRLAFQRLPDADELAAGIMFLNTQQATYAGPEAKQSALADFCQALFCLNEFVYIN